MERERAKEQWLQIAVCFYQERIREGMEQFESAIAAALECSVPEETVAVLLDAISKRDYVLAADIFYYEMAAKI